MVRIDEYFDVLLGTNLGLVDKELDHKGINFVARTSVNNGIVAKVKRLPDIEPNPSNTISVAASGSVMESFLQKEPYYSSFHLFVLKPKLDFSDKQLLFYCMCLRANKYKFNYGRQADKTLKELKIPSITEIPAWVEHVVMPDVPNDKSVINVHLTLEDRSWGWFEYQTLFAITRGTGARKDNINRTGNVPLITSIDSHNGLVGYVTKPPAHTGNVITVNRNGSVGQAYYQPTPFCSTEDVHVFIPLFELNIYRAMFLLPLIMKEKFRYSYGRKWGIDRMNKTKIKLPVTTENNPDWQFMEDYIKSLPSSSNL